MVPKIHYRLCNFFFRFDISAFMKNILFAVFDLV